MYITEALKKMDEQYMDQRYKMCGPSLALYPDSCDSSRMNMATGALKQVVCILEPEIARLQTGHENQMGSYNKAYRKLEGEWAVVDKIYKFDNPAMYALILYREEDDMYDIIEKVVVEDLSEKFGYVYNTNIMDRLEKGDRVKDKIIYRSTSYDDDMNYRMGLNANVMTATDPCTLEDCITINKRWAKKVKVISSDTASVNINNNDVLLNIYGDKDHYQGFPEIGQQVKDSFICALRRINFNNILYDFQSDNINKIHLEDKVKVASAGSIVYDINVYCNNIDKMPDNIFYAQIRKYHTYCVNYAAKITDWCTKIKKSGSNYTQDIAFYKDKYQDYGESSKQWKPKDKAFDNVMIEFKLVNIGGLKAGYKMTGRYGDKGVIGEQFNDHYGNDVGGDTKYLQTLVQSLGIDPIDDHGKPIKIALVDEDEMPYTKEGVSIDVMVNASGGIRRLNTGTLEEPEFNFQAERIRQYICTLNTHEEKLAVIFKYLSILRNNQFAILKKYYTSLTESISLDDRYTLKFTNRSMEEAFVKEIETEGFYIIKPPFSDMHFECISEIYDTFPFIKPYDVYVKRFGMEKKVMNPMVIGAKYMFILKHTTFKNFSVRSTGRLNKKGLPEKTNMKKNNLSVNSTTPVALTEFWNISSQIDGLTYAEYNLFMRNSTISKKQLKDIINCADNPLELKKLKVEHNFTNTSAQMLNACLLGIGIRLEFGLGGNTYAPIVKMIQNYTVLGEPITDFLYLKEEYYTLLKARNDYLNKKAFIETYPGERFDLAMKEVLKDKSIKKLEIYERAKEVFTDKYKREFEASSIEVEPKKKRAKKEIDPEMDELLEEEIKAEDIDDEEIIEVFPEDEITTEEINEADILEELDI